MASVNNIEHARDLAEVQNFAMDSTRWKEFPYRDGDVVIASWARSGTTWLQQIVGRLLLGAVRAPKLDWVSPWIEHRMEPWALVRLRLQTQGHRRFVKTHLPASAIPVSDRARYLFIGRDGRDIAISLYNFHCNHTPLAYRLIEARCAGLTPLRPPTRDLGGYFDEWLDGDGYPWWPFWSHIRSWWRARTLPNVCLVHFATLSSSSCAEVGRIAAFLGIALADDECQRIVQDCSLERMKASSSELFSLSSRGLLAGGMTKFFRTGRVGEWRQALDPARIQRYEDRVRAELDPECAAWLASGNPTAHVLGNPVTTMS